ncbi:hypothetical protein FQN53_002149 [Emmonsiellopsis sp. PD_33]|nr:hypothetical protein FQN53_002149 [Emmonsiellopsis sp. PD_33]
MSFGYSITDLISLTTLSWNLYKSCKSAPASFASLSSEVLSLHAVLKEAEETLFPQQHDSTEEKPSHHSTSISPTAQENLRTITDGCHAVLVDLQLLLDRYESIGRKRSNAWERVKWGGEDLSELRSRLMTNVSMLNTFITISQFAVRKKLDRYLSRRRSKRESFLSEETVDSLPLDEKVTWRMIRKELEDIGITVAAFDANKEFILNWFAEAVEAGDFQPNALDPDPRGHNFQDVDEAESGSASPPTARDQQRDQFKLGSRVATTSKSEEEAVPQHWKPSFSTSPTVVEPSTSQHSQSPKHRESLMTAIRKGSFSEVREILAKPEINSEVYNDAVQTAISSGNHRIVQLLLEEGRDIEALGAENYTNAILAASFDGKEEILNLLFTKCPSHNTAFQSLFPAALKAASIRGHTYIITNLLTQYYTHLNLPLHAHHLSSALRVAATQGHTEIVRQLLRHGADPNRDKWYYFGNPLQAASYKGHYDIVVILLQHNAAPNSGDYQFGSALQAASLQGHLRIVSLLLEHGADVNMRGGKYGTALQAAEFKGLKEIVGVLMQNGAGIRVVRKE